MSVDYVIEFKTKYIKQISYWKNWIREKVLRIIFLYDCSMFTIEERPFYEFVHAYVSVCDCLCLCMYLCDYECLCLCVCLWVLWMWVCVCLWLYMYIVYSNALSVVYVLCVGALAHTCFSFIGRIYIGDQLVY